MNISNGALATLLYEPKVSLLFFIDDEWALAKEEEINNNEWA